MGYASTYRINNGVYRSTGSSTTWSLLSNTPSSSTISRIDLTVVPSANTTDRHVLYVAISNWASRALICFLRFDNADAATPTFTNLTASTPNFLAQQGLYDIIIGIDPTNVANIYASGYINYSTGN